MANRAELEELLKSEYGIGSVHELRKAILEIGGLDISMFCSEISPKRRKKHETEAARTVPCEVQG